MGNSKDTTDVEPEPVEVAVDDEFSQTDPDPPGQYLTGLRLHLVTAALCMCLFLTNLEIPKTVKETTDKNTALEARVTALELENQWLKNLITEKNGQTAQEEKKSETDIANMFKKFLASQKASTDRSSSESKIGVGTA